MSSGGEHGRYLNGSAQFEEEVFTDTEDLGSVVHVNDEVSASCPFNLRGC